MRRCTLAACSVLILAASATEALPQRRPVETGTRIVRRDGIDYRVTVERLTPRPPRRRPVYAPLPPRRWSHPYTYAVDWGDGRGYRRTPHSQVSYRPGLYRPGAVVAGGDLYVTSRYVPAGYPNYYGRTYYGEPRYAPTYARPDQIQSITPLSDLCQTPAGTCGLPREAPLGAGCACATNDGQVPGWVAAR